MLPCQKSCCSIAREGFAYRREHRTPQFIAMALLRAAWSAIERLSEFLRRLCVLRCSPITGLFLE